MGGKEANQGIFQILQEFFRYFSEFFTHVKFLSNINLDAVYSKGKRNLYAGAGTYQNPSFRWVFGFNGTSAPIHLLYMSFLLAKFDVSICVAKSHEWGKEEWGQWQLKEWWSTGLHPCYFSTEPTSLYSADMKSRESPGPHPGDVETGMT